MKKFFKQNLKLFIGIFIGIIITGIGVYGATLLTTEEVMYTSSKTAKAAIDELYNKVNTMKTVTEYNNYGTTRYNAGYTAGVTAGKNTFFNSSRISVSGPSSFSGNAGIKGDPRVNTNPYGVKCLVYWKISRGYSNGDGSHNHRVWVDGVLVYQGDEGSSGTTTVKANGNVQYAASGCNGSADRDGYTLTIFVCPNS